MGESTAAYIMLSPESHDPKISAAAGRGTYTMEQMENWIPRALDAGVQGRDDLVLHRHAGPGPAVGHGHVAYSEQLIKQVRRVEALPLICPIVSSSIPAAGSSSSRKSTATASTTARSKTTARPWSSRCGTGG